MDIGVMIVIRYTNIKLQFIVNHNEIYVNYIGAITS